MKNGLKTAASCGTAVVLTTALGLVAGAAVAADRIEVTEADLVDVSEDGLGLPGARSSSSATAAAAEAQPQTRNLAPLLRAPDSYAATSAAFTQSVAQHVQESSQGDLSGGFQASTMAQEEVPAPAGSVTELTEDGIAIAALSDEVDLPADAPGVVGLVFDDYAAVEFEIRTRAEDGWSDWRHVHVEDAGDEGKPGTDPFYVADAESLQLRVLGEQGAPEHTRMVLVDPKRRASDAEAIRDNPPAEIPASSASEETAGGSGESGGAGGSEDAGAQGAANVTARANSGRTCTTGGCTCPQCAVAASGAQGTAAAASAEGEAQAGTQGSAAGASAEHAVHRPAGEGASVQNVAKTEAKKPEIRPRKSWGADESLKKGSPDIASKVSAAVIHHTDGQNDYSQEDVPAILRGIYAFHVNGRGWADVGYNVLADKYGRLWEGRAGGVDKAVVGAHAAGYNTGTFGISVLGSFDEKAPPQETLDAVSSAIAWKLGKDGVSADGKATVAGERIDAIVGHRDLGTTSCPGDAFYAAFGDVRTTAKEIQDGRDLEAEKKAEEEKKAAEEAERKKAEDEEKAEDDGLQGGVADGLSGGAADLT